MQNQAQNGLEYSVQGWADHLYYSSCAASEGLEIIPEHTFTFASPISLIPAKTTADRAFAAGSFFIDQNPEM